MGVRVSDLHISGALVWTKVYTYIHKTYIIYMYNIYTYVYIYKCIYMLIYIYICQRRDTQCIFK